MNDLKEFEVTEFINNEQDIKKGGPIKDTIIKVNEQPVKLEGKEATGMQIKLAAITQGVHIQQNFVLQKELPNGTSKIIGDEDEVKLRPNLAFTAIAPDDNS